MNEVTNLSNEADQSDGGFARTKLNNNKWSTRPTTTNGFAFLKDLIFFIHYDIKFDSLIYTHANLVYFGL